VNNLLLTNLIEDKEHHWSLRKDPFNVDDREIIEGLRGCLQGEQLNLYLVPNGG